MRAVAWALVAAGLGIALVALAVYFIEDYAAWYAMRREPPIPWPLLGLGAVVAAFGTLLLAIRPPALRPPSGNP